MQDTILVVDDENTNIDIILGILGEDCDAVVAKDAAEARAVLEREKVDLILLDIMMPGTDGYTFCRELKDNAELADIPVIFVTAKTDEESLQKGFDVGGVDYVKKPISAVELKARVNTHLRLSATLKQLRFLASKDPMTGIYNRRRFFELANERFAQMTEADYAVMIDLDEFKTINDTYGHQTGDTVLKTAVTALQGTLGQDALLGRLGGEEFALLLHSESDRELESKLLRAKTALNKATAAQGIPATASFGVCAYDKSCLNIDKMLCQADTALYQAKAAGRNRIAFSKV